MKRSGGVTAASFSMIVASGAFCLYEVWSLHPLAAMHSGEFGILITFLVFQLAFAAWAIATGTALLRLRRWAWPSAVTISALLILFNIPGLLDARKLIRATTGVPTVSAGDFVSHQYVHLVALTLIPFALGVWWLVFFARRGVRLQFATAASVPGEEGNFVPARSDAVTIAAVVLLVGSALLLLIAVVTPLTLLMEPQSNQVFPFRRMLIGVGFFYLLMAAWGVVTAIGALRRRSWGRILMIATGALGAAVSLLGSVGAVMGMIISPPSPQVSASAMRAGIAVIIVVVLIPLGISIWWLVLFTRPRVAREFASPRPALGFPVDAAAVAALPVNIDLQENVPLASRAVPHFAALAMPLSIRIIAVLEIVLGAMALLGPLNAKFFGMTPPTLVFGFLVHGWGTSAFYMVSGIAPILFGAVILCKRSWGLDALIVFLLAQIANFGLMFVSPARAKFSSEIETQLQSFTARMKMPYGSAAPPSAVLMHMNLFYGVTLAVSIVLYAVLLYFLITRRKAFRAACAAAQSSAPGGE